MGGLDDEMFEATLKDIPLRLKGNNMMMEIWEMERMQYPEKFRLLSTILLRI